MVQPTVAIVGASADRRKYGNKSLRAHASQGYQVFPINPLGGEVEGIPVCRTIDEVPTRPLDRVSMYVPPKVGITLLPAIARVGCHQLWFNPGSYDAAMRDEAQRLGLPVIIGCSIVELGVSPQDFPD